MEKKQTEQKITSFNDFLKKVYDKKAQPEKEKIKYDDIVDTSNFMPSSEKKRNMIATGNIGAGEKGLYDYEPNTKVTKENSPTDVEIALREGKLDKADIQKLKEIYQEQGKETIETETLKEADKQEKQAKKNREKALDDRLGINQEE